MLLAPEAVLLTCVLAGAAVVQAQTAPAQPAPMPPLEQLLKMRIVYTVPGMDQALVRRDVVYKSVPLPEGKLDLKADVYVPAQAKPDQRFPAVLLISGGNEGPPDWRTAGVYQSYGQLLAASGFVGVPFQKRFKPSYEGLEQGESDIKDLVRYLREHAAELHVDPDRLAVWGFSGGGFFLGFPLREAPPPIRAVLAFYAALDLRGDVGNLPARERQRIVERFSPLAQLKTGAQAPPLFVARAGLDNPLLNSGIDDFVREALAGNRAIEVLTHPTGRHAFDILDDNDRSREIIRSALEFLRTQLAASSSGNGRSSDMESETVAIERKTCTVADRVNIVYSAAGAGKTGLLFIHGGLANRSFWDHELRTFAGQYRVLAPDLAGHGESGANRPKWGMAEFGADVRAVIEAEHLDRVLLFGNSLGGPVGVEAALQLPRKVLGVVGVDTFHRLDARMAPEDARKRGEMFRADYAGSIKEMTKALFHPDADPAVVTDAEQRMARTSPETAYHMFEGIGGYDMAASVRRLTVPLRAINGDLYPTDMEGNRQIKPDFDAMLMKHVGHYPMLERPEEFDRLVAAMAQALLAAGAKAAQ